MKEITLEGGPAAGTKVDPETLSRDALNYWVEYGGKDFRYSRQDTNDTTMWFRGQDNHGRKRDRYSAAELASIAFDEARRKSGEPDIFTQDD